MLRMENNNLTTKLRGRPIKLDKKPLCEITQFHNERLKEIGYFKNYYIEKSNLVSCPICNKELKEYNLKKHQKTIKCLKCII